MSLREERTAAVSSMTGYGRATGETPVGRVTVEVRSLNHRHLDSVIRTPRGLMHLDPGIRNMVREGVSRGKVEVFITLEEGPADMTINTEAALRVARALEPIAGSLGDNVRLEHVIAAGEIFQVREREFDPEVTAAVVRTVGDALGKMANHRLQEGKVLSEDLLARMKDLRGLVSAIRDLAPEVAVRARKNMEQFLADIDMGDRVEPQRLETEIAMLAQRADITEEITRLGAHQDSFEEALAAGGVVGRRLDFLVQEMHREINTIGSKSGLPDISEMVVRFKTGLEKVREQVQNIE